ncbi:sugar kinase [Nocardia sp. NBC_01009]|uniref:sugar kinase n=1 Tax=Nocardia sp. NBC_01009 TaxID=2975996 RepID=UPI0038695A85|nr:sugar kinase [Nocardia sp. NBC_01009]
MNTPLDLLCIGECMVELRGRPGAQDPRPMALSFGGDSANVAIYLAHYGAAGSSVRTHYLTAVGEDRYSGEMLDWLNRHHVGTESVSRITGKTAGMYLIEVDDHGERSFVYYRGQSAARQLFTDATPDAEEAIDGADWVYLSGISVAILTEAARAVLYRRLDSLRARGGKVVFDTNYRPVLWSGTAEARNVVTEVLRRTDLALPTCEDEQELFGDKDEHATVDRLQDLGIGEIAVKLGHRGVYVADGGDRTYIPAVTVAALDTTAAGDSFNAGYLYRKICGATAVEAARAGVEVAAAVVAHPGAIIEPHHLPPMPGCKVRL